ncbi:hypothetical protein [Rhizobium sp. FY34]|uniref:hypothetical protein n=1 Tax=Rhizobium sp. FY34 TaxID=2562309 RepID=UPI0010BFD24A|nr:hypothetical protein [Rhizobium sp. FY34]
MLEIIGDSHILALRDAGIEAGNGAMRSKHGQIRIAQLGHGYNFLEPFFSFDGKNVAFTQGPAKSTFERLNKDQAPVIQPNDARRFVFMFGLYPSFGFNVDHWKRHTAASWDADRQFVTQSAFNAIIDETVKQPLAFFRTLADMKVRFSVASCCPVPASYHRLTGAKTFVDREIPLIYNRFRDHVAGRLEKMGIPCHLPPPEVYDENGAMLDSFAKSPGDYHANPAYGRLMLSKILAETDAFT